MGLCKLKLKLKLKLKQSWMFLILFVTLFVFDCSQQLPLFNTYIKQKEQNLS